MLLPSPGGTSPGWLGTAMNYQTPLIAAPIVWSVVRLSVEEEADRELMQQAPPLPDRLHDRSVAALGTCHGRTRCGHGGAHVWGRDLDE
ncbi:hypothetical protein HDG35_005410 [Paraburkholderia sp. JPY681]|nr:hypothetical protein [Paraburkholderia atlantica]